MECAGLGLGWGGKCPGDPFSQFTDQPHFLGGRGNRLQSRRPRSLVDPLSKLTLSLGNHPWVSGVESETDAAKPFQQAGFFRSLPDILVGLLGNLEKTTG